MFESVRHIGQEHGKNWRLILKIAYMDSGKQTVRSSLGILWTYFRDILFIGVFVLFRMLIAGNDKISGMDSVVYLVTGMIPWFFINDVLVQGGMSIRNNRGIIQSLHFPVVILPTISVISILMKRLLSFLLIFVVCILFGYGKAFHLGLFVYYMFAMLCLMLSLSLVTTAIISVSDDFRQLYEAVLRIMIYTMPILWDFSRVKAVLPNVLLRINPMVYIIKGFRDAFVLGHTQDSLYTVYFWCCVVGLFGVGSFLQFRLRKYYADLI